MRRIPAVFLTGGYIRRDPMFRRRAGPVPWRTSKIRGGPWGESGAFDKLDSLRAGYA